MSRFGLVYGPHGLSRALESVAQSLMGWPNYVGMPPVPLRDASG